MLDSIVIGAGQAGLATSYYLHKWGLNFQILDAEPSPGAAWRHAWPSLTLFSNSASSNLPGWPMPHHEGFPPASHVIEYFTCYEQRYDLLVRRPVRVQEVTHDGENFHVTTNDECLTARTVVAATGTWSAPFIPFYPGSFSGRQWHSAVYPGPDPFRGESVAVVGAGNSGAQIAAELVLSGVDTTWFTAKPPRWMPDNVDGRVLFQHNHARLIAIMRGEPDPGAGTNLGDIVVVPPVQRARDEGLLEASPMFCSLDDVEAKHLIWCTGFRPALGPFRTLLNGRTPPSRAFSLSGTEPGRALGQQLLPG